MNSQYMNKLDIAIIGSGIAGLTAAKKLYPHHTITVYEANDWIGGHTHTIDVEHQGRHHAVDTGFIVFNDWTYPNFIRLMEEIGVESQASEMGFSVHCEKSGLEYAGGSIDQLFAQRRNLASPAFLRMLFDILRFNRNALGILDTAGDDMTLGEFLHRHNYSAMFRDYYIIPMGAAIWSANVATMLAFPVRFFVRFFHNHGLLNVQQRPQWRVIKGGSRRYVEPLTRGFADRIRTNTPVLAVDRQPDAVLVRTHTEVIRHDAVVFACHSDQALALLGGGASPGERRILGAMPYQENEVILHTDTSLLPMARKVWSSWNYWLPRTDSGRVQLTYNMNILQGIDADSTFCVTLNQSGKIDPAKIIDRYVYHHPVYTPDGVVAQQRLAEINGVNRSYFCGAYWHNGFHEDGVVSGINVAKAFGVLV